MPKRPDQPSASPPSLATLAKAAGRDEHHEHAPLPRFADAQHTDADGRSWNCRVGFAVLDGQLQPVSFEIRGPEGADRRITTALIRSLPVATIEEEARQHLLRTADVRLAFEHALAGPEGSPGLDAARRDRSRLQGGPDSIFLRYVAALYKQATEAGDRAPGKTIARAVSEMRGQHASAVAARNWIRRCRQLGLLPPADTKKDRP